MIRTILFDLDETLYPPTSGIMDELRVLILAYIRTRFDLSIEEAEELRRHYFLNYGTTMRGLQLNHDIDPDDFLDFVHDIPLHEYLRPNPLLDRALETIPQDKVVFTNASREHAERVLNLLGIRHHFSRIVDVRDMNYESKPQPGAYQRICELLAVRPEECLLVEDNIRNLLPAKSLGMRTMLVRDGIEGGADSVDCAIERIEEIGEAIRRLTAGEECS